MAKQKAPVELSNALMDSLIADAKKTREKMLEAEEAFRKAEITRKRKKRMSKLGIASVKKHKKRMNMTPMQKWWQNKRLNSE